MLTWNDIENHALYPTHSTAIEHCSAGAITPTQVAHLLAGGVLRDNIEVDAYDEWESEQEGDWGYEDRYAAYQDDDIVERIEDVEEDLDSAYEAFCLMVERIKAVEERLEEVEGNQYFRQTPRGIRPLF